METGESPVPCSSLLCESCRDDRHKTGWKASPSLAFRRQSIEDACLTRKYCIILEAHFDLILILQDTPYQRVVP